MRSISQSIKGFSRLLKKLLKYFKGTTISTYFVLPSAGSLPVILALNLNDSEFTMLTFGIYLGYCSKPPVFE